MAVYLFDNNQKLIKIVADEATKDSIQTQELPDDGNLLKDYYHVSIKNDEILENVQYVAIKSHEGNSQSFEMYRVISQKTDKSYTTLEGIQLAYYELSGHIITDRRPQNISTSWFINSILQESDWRLGYVDNDLPKLTTSIYYKSIKDSLAAVQSATGVEMRFKVEISGSRITDKWVEVYNKLGNENLKRFNYGTNALKIVKETSHQELYTALIGRGKGEEVSSAEDNDSGQAGYGRKINFEDVEWSTANGDPLNKPTGQLYLENPVATEEFGIQTINGDKIPRVGIVEFNDTEDKNELINRTYESLKYYSRPKVLFKADVINIGDVNIGDTVTIHRHDLNIHYKTRVRKVERNIKNNNKTKIELGDVLHNSSTKKQKQFSSNLNNLQDQLETLQAEQRVTSIEARNGVTTNFTNDEPQRKKTGDLWYRDHPSLAGKTQLLMWNGNSWELLLDTSVTDAVEKQVDEALEKADDAIIRADQITTEVYTAVANAGFQTVDELIQSQQLTLEELLTDVEKVNVEVTQSLQSLSQSTQQALDNADQLKDWADNLEIGGVNLLRGTSDELEKFTKTDGWWDWGIKSVPADRIEKYGIDVGVPLSYRVYIENPSQDAAAVIQFVSNTNEWRQHYGNWIPAGQSGWSTVTITVSENDIKDLSRVDVSVKGETNEGTHTVYLSHKKLERGTIPTDWDYNPQEAFLEIDKTNEALNLKAGREELNSVEQIARQNELDIKLNSDELLLKANQKSLDLATQQIEENALKINTTAYELGLKADKTVVDELNNQVTNNSAQIQINADEISKRLTSVEVDQKISGLAQTTYVDNQVKNTADSFEQKLSSYVLEEQLKGLATVEGTQTLVSRTSSELSDIIATVEGKIPTDYENTNYYRQTSDKWRETSFSGWNTTIYPVYKITVNSDIQPTDVVTVSGWVNAGDYPKDLMAETRGTAGNYQFVANNYAAPLTSKRSKLTFEVPIGTTEIRIMIRNDSGLIPLDIARFKEIKLEKGSKATPWVPAHEDKVEVTAFNELTRTVEETKSTINNAEGDISRLTQRADSLESTLSSKVDTETLNGYVTTTHLNQNYSTSQETVSTIASMTSGLATETSVNEIRQTAENNIASISNLNNEISTIEQNINGLQATVGGKASQSQVTQLANGFNVLVSDINSSGRRNLLPNTSNKNKIVSWSSWDYIHSSEKPSHTNIREGDTVTLSLFVWRTNAPVVAFFQLVTHDNQYIQYNGNRIDTNTSGWTSVTVKVPSLNNVKEIRCSIRNLNNSHATVDFHSMKLEFGDTITPWVPALEDYATQAQFSVLNNAILGKVEKGDVYSQLLLDAEGILFDTTGDLILSADKVTVDASRAFIPSAAITELTADKITTGTLNASNVNIINLNVHSIVGLDSNFIRSRWNSGVGGGVEVDGTGLTTYASNGDFMKIDSGRLRFGVGSVQAMLQTTGVNRRGLKLTPLDDRTKGIDFDLYSEGDASINFGRDASVEGFLYRIRAEHPWDIWHELKQRGSKIYFGPYDTNYQLRMSFTSPQSPEFGLYHIGNWQVSTGVKLNHNGYFEVIGVSGNASVLANGYHTPSDERLKDDMVATKEDSYEKAKIINYYDFVWKADGTPDFGVKAQDLVKVDPLLIKQQGEGYMSVDTTRLLYTYGDALKEAIHKIEQLEAKIKTLEESA